MKAKSKVDYKADFILKLEKKEEEKTRQEAERGKRPPDSLITWIFQDDFIPRGKITKDGSYSIVSDHLGTPVEAYDEKGNKVWERELDIYGRVKTGRKDIFGRTEKELGTRNFIPFRFQGQYEDEEIGLYYNRFRYYSPEDGCYTQQDPIGLEGNNPTLYGYVKNLNIQVDIFGLSFWDMVTDFVDRTGRKFQGAEVYKFIDKVKVDSVKFKPGDYFYLDNLHKDHYETFSKLNESKGVFNTDGSLNVDKTNKAFSRKGPGY